MYESIKGILKEKEPLKAVVESYGIGYRLTIPLNTFTRLPAVESNVQLFLSQVVREDSNTLYAFSGIGPKTAVGIIGHMDMQTFHNAILSADTRILSKLPGIGKKTAERLVLEMRDKVKNKKDPKAQVSFSSVDTILSDAINALMNLGYSPLDAQKAVQTARVESKEENDLGKIITLALKKI
jgi:holliday junction DNA helicase RuvA